MGSNKFLQMLSNKSCSGENYFHEACKAHSLMMTERNYNGEQCTHFIAKYKDYDAREMMFFVVKLHQGRI
ncbi:GSCOCT00014315001.2-RA-CDS [Cotesia congregata]|uniref:Cc_vank.5_26.2 n=2 Tax=root TaxID=1 RepID=S6D4X9_COTCN|nr:GSCOCT00014315001.2-RA-CDS [Cotesia congregata]CAE47496.2 putative ankyrin protein 5 [Bracoviriform congregatae]CAG5094020.1 cc_vank.5_26.2 [Cotesia congregata]CCQ71372.1 protein tyrosine phosphatase VANK-5 [Cotesia congregata]